MASDETSSISIKEEDENTPMERSNLMNERHRSPVSDDGGVNDVDIKPSIRRMSRADKRKSGDTLPPGVRPTATDACATIVQHLMLFNKHSDEEFSRKACESLVKKMKEKKDELDALIIAVSTKGVESAKCITIARTLDGRLQVAGRKGFPHVVYARIFRWPELHKNELKHHPSCACAFELKSDSVCVNPYHYERIVQPVNLDFGSLNIDKPSSPLLFDLKKSSASSSSRRDILSPVSMAGPSFNRSLSLFSPESLLATTSSFSTLNAIPSNVFSLTPTTLAEHKPLQTIENIEAYTRIANFANLRKNVLNVSRIEPDSSDDHCNWGSLEYYEHSVQIKEMQIQYNEMYVDGKFGESPQRLCLGLEVNIHRTEECERTRRTIGEGLRLAYKANGDVWMQLYSSRPCFVQSHYLDRESGRVPGDLLHKIYPGARVKIFDLAHAKSILQQALHKSTMAKDYLNNIPTPMDSLFDTYDPERLQKEAKVGPDQIKGYSITRISFAKGWGPDYKRATINDCPCWLQVKMNKGYDYLDSLLNEYLALETQNDVEEESKPLVVESAPSTSE